MLTRVEMLVVLLLVVWGFGGVVVTSRPTHVSQDLVVLAVSAPDGLGYLG